VTRARSLATRAAVGAALFLLLGGPTPGAVGSCGSDDLDRPADFQSYCLEREQLICVRRGMRREISKGQEQDCRWDAIDFCEAVNDWSPRCQPTERVTRACLNALRSLDTLHTPEDDLEECDDDALCTVSQHHLDDAGVSGP
jgi:hypothetical protein